ncbi:hypothetical protein LCGC14_0622770 [marine sediment metagenome]|uniref:Uncharacterized protein n=1 Tax=marine sediment metagenome TaxID=412755 RepID=A0A0F9TQT1_9ZZZZ
MGKSKHKLANPKIVRCKCGRDFSPLNHSVRYCSPECKKNFGRDWSKIKRNFNNAHPDLCNICGCNNSGSKFKNCLECRINRRIYQRAYKKKNEVKT